jgi:alkaline phosphatase
MEMIEFDETVQGVARWAAERDDTLILITADHECGGLQVIRGNGKGNMPDVRWSTRGHTLADVPVFAWGVGAKRFAGKMDNTQFAERILPLPVTERNIDRVPVEPAPVP